MNGPLKLPTSHRLVVTKSSELTPRAWIPRVAARLMTTMVVARVAMPIHWVVVGVASKTSQPIRMAVSGKASSARVALDAGVLDSHS